MSIQSVLVKKFFSLFLLCIFILLPLKVYAFGLPSYPVYKPPVKSKMNAGVPDRAVKKNKYPEAKKNLVHSQIILPLRNAEKSKLENSVMPVYLNVKKGETKTLYIARKFINRIVFPYYVKYARTSKTGDISVLLQGKTALISVTPYIVAKGPVKRAVFPKSLSSAMFRVYHQTYSFIFVPKDIPPQTLYINMENTAASSIKINVKGGLASYLYPVMRSVYNGVNPRSFTDTAENVIYKSNYHQVGIKLVKKFNGNNLEIYEFVVKNMSKSPISISNKEFLYLKKNVIAISVSNEHLFPKTYTRLFIVTRRMIYGR